MGVVNHRHLMTHTLESPAGDLATFQQVADFIVFTIGNDIVELSVEDARKVWKALTLCQWQPNG
jgi:hypothetical protein